MNARELAKQAEGKYRILVGGCKEVLGLDGESRGYVFSFEELGEFVAALKKEWEEEQNG